MNKRLIGSVAVLLSCSAIYSTAPFAKPDQTTDNTFVFTCNDFAERIQTCEHYSCEILLLGNTTVTEIKGKKGDRCVVAFIVGSPRAVQKNVLQQKANNTKTPISTICEYDREGIEQLSNKYEAMRHGNFDFSSKQKGEYNCTTSALGQTFPTPRESLSKGSVVSKENK